MMEILAKETLHFFIGLYGVCFLYSIYYVLEQGIERLVKLVGNKIAEHRKAKTIQE